MINAMRNLLFFFFCINLFSFCSSKQQKADDCPYSKLLADKFGTSSNFITVDIKGADSVFTVVISSQKFYRMVFMDKRIRTEEYVKDVVDHWREGKPFVVDLSDEKPLRDYAIKKDTALEKLLSLSKDQIIARYFDKNILKGEAIDFRQEDKIIYSLIKAGVPCHRDDMSGYVVVQDTVISTNCK